MNDKQNFKVRYKSIIKQLESLYHKNDSDTINFFINLIKNKSTKYGNYDQNPVNKMKLYFADGSIGSGKSTILKNYIVHNYMQNLLYYNPETYVNTFYSGSNFIDEYNRVKLILWQDMEKRLETGESFIVESVFTKESKITFLKKARKIGYSLIGLYVGTSSSDLNISRSIKRTELSGFAIPKEKIIDRYQKSLNSLYKLFRLADEYIVCDNSGDYVKIVVYKFKSNIYCSNTQPLWTKKYLIKHLKINIKDE